MLRAEVRVVTYLRVKKFWEYQNADAWKKARKNKGGHKHPAWCKLYVARDLKLDAEEPIVRLVFYELLRLATVNANVIPNESETIAKAISMTPGQVAKAVDRLLKGAWLSETKSARPSREFLETFYTDRDREEIRKTSREPVGALEKPPKPAPTEARSNGNGWIENLNSYTGCKLVRGTHAFHAVRETLGTDRPPADWPYPRPTLAEIRKALAA